MRVSKAGWQEGKQATWGGKENSFLKTGLVMGRWARWGGGKQGTRICGGKKKGDLEDSQFVICTWQGKGGPDAGPRKRG